MGRPAAKAGVGDFFGEIALLHDVPRTAILQGRQPSQCYSLSRDQFIRLLEVARAATSLDRLASERLRQSHYGAGH